MFRRQWRRIEVGITLILGSCLVPLVEHVVEFALRRVILGVVLVGVVVVGVGQGRGFAVVVLPFLGEGLLKLAHPFHVVGVDALVVDLLVGFFRLNDRLWLLAGVLLRLVVAGGLVLVVVRPLVLVVLAPILGLVPHLLVPLEPRLARVRRAGRGVPAPGLLVEDGAGPRPRDPPPWRVLLLPFTSPGPRVSVDTEVQFGVAAQQRNARDLVRLRVVFRAAVGVGQDALILVGVLVPAVVVVKQ